MLVFSAKRNFFVAFTHDLNVTRRKISKVKQKQKKKKRKAKITQRNGKFERWITRTNSFELEEHCGKHNSRYGNSIDDISVCVEIWEKSKESQHTNLFRVPRSHSLFHYLSFFVNAMLARLLLLLLLLVVYMITYSFITVHTSHIAVRGYISQSVSFFCFCCCCWFVCWFYFLHLLRITWTHSHVHFAHWYCCCFYWINEFFYIF